jgi:hypothetical protein
MSEAGLAALKRVLSERRVAVQFVSPLLYVVLENRIVPNENWMPMVLLPPRAANLNAERWLSRVSQSMLDRLQSMPQENGRYQVLKPSPVQSTADQFAL